MSDQQLTIIGNLTADPELRYTQNGLAVANFTIAQTPRIFDKKTKEYKDGDTLYMRCSVWREFAEQLAGSLVKGSRVIATGALKQRDYEKDGIKRTSIELDIEDIGASMKHATVQITRVNKTGAPVTTPAAEPWATTMPADTDDLPF